MHVKQMLPNGMPHQAVVVVLARVVVVLVVVTKSLPPSLIN